MVGKGVLKGCVQIRRLVAQQTLFDVVRPSHHRDGFPGWCFVMAVQMKTVDQPNQHARKRPIMRPNAPAVHVRLPLWTSFSKEVANDRRARGQAQDEGRQVPTAARSFFRQHGKEDLKTQ